MDLTFILTEDCNYRCTYCYQPAYAPRRLALEDAVAAFEAALASGVRSLSLTFFGGEPFLEAETLFEALGHVRRRERETGVPAVAKVSTNGSRLDPATVDRARSLGLFVSLSFDGLPEVQDRGRPRADGGPSAKEAERALDLLLEARVPFAVYSVVTPDNVDRLSASRAHLWRRGARLLVTALDYTASWGPDSIRILEREYARLGKLYERWLRRGDRFQVEPLDARISQWTRAGAWRRCSPGIRQVTVGTDGRLYPCVEHFYRRTGAIGTARTWLDAARVQERARARGGLAPECEECGIRDRCNQTCACVNLRGTGRPNRPPLSLCLTEQALVAASDRIAARLYRKRVPGFLIRHYSASYHLLSAVEEMVRELDPLPVERPLEEGSRCPTVI